MVRVNVELDLPPGVELLGYERSGDGHGFEVKFPLPDSCRCEKCGHEEAASYEYKNTVYVVRDLDLWGQPSFLIFQPCFHRCSRCGQPFTDQSFILGSTGSGLPSAEIMIFAVECNHGLICGLVATVLGDSGFSRRNVHVRPSFLSESGSLPDFLGLFGPHCRPPAGILS